MERRTSGCQSARKPASRSSVRRRSSSPAPKRPGLLSRSASDFSEASVVSAVHVRTMADAAEDGQEASIRVVARVRPRLGSESRAVDGVDLSTCRNELTLTSGRGECKRFTVDQVFDSRQDQGSQEAVFSSFGRSFVTQSLGGYNVCLFAYGHTGSGKTYTMLGDRNSDSAGSQAGIMPRFLYELFAAHARDLVTSVKRRYTCEFFEVYNEQIKDLLAPSKSGERTRRVHVHPKFGVRVENLSMSEVNSAEEAMRLLDYGNQRRAVAATSINSQSSRSHAVFTFKYEQETGDGQSCQSTVTFVDLAGREDQTASQNQATQFREMCCINTSLFHLSNVISKLSQGSFDRRSLADFRNSKLTLLLSPALIGNSRTALIATVSPLQSYFDDSVSTLSFAASVKRIKTRPIINNKTPNTVVGELEAEVRQLQSELALSKNGEAEKERALLSAQALICSYRRSWEEALAKSQEAEITRKKSLKTLGTAIQGVLAPKEQASDLPAFLTKLSDDRALQGHCNFFFRDGKSLRFGSDEDTCDVVLSGLGIRPQMCEVRLTSSGNVEVELLQTRNGTVPRVLVNGYPLLPSEGVRTIGHGGCLFLGYSHAFRLVAATREMLVQLGSADTCTLARSTVKNLDVAAALNEIVDEDGEQFKDILPFVSQLSTRLADDAVQSMMGSLHLLCPLVDEANEMTQEICGNDELHFRLRALTDVFNVSQVPDFVVCLMAKGRGDTAVHRLVRSTDKGTGGRSLVQVWNTDSFFCHVQAIREILEDPSADGKDKLVRLRQQLSGEVAQTLWRYDRSGDSGSSSSKCSSSESTALPGSLCASTSNSAAYPASISTPSGMQLQDSRPIKACKDKCKMIGDDMLSTSASSIGDLSGSAAFSPTSESSVGTGSESSGMCIIQGEVQHSEWVSALGAKIGSLNREVSQLQDMVLLQEHARPASSSTAVTCPEDLRHWMREVELLRDRIDKLTHIADLQTRRGAQNQAPSPKTPAATVDAVPKAEIRADVAKIVKEEIRDHLLTQTHIQALKATTCSTGSSSVSLPLEPPMAPATSHEFRQISTPSSAGAPQKRPSPSMPRSSEKPRAQFGPASGVVRKASPAPSRRTTPVTRRGSDSISRTSSGGVLTSLRSQRSARASLRSVSPGARAPVASSGSASICDKVKGKPGVSRRSSTPSTSPPRKLIGPFPKFSWAFYEVLDNA